VGHDATDDLPAFCRGVVLGRVLCGPVQAPAQLGPALVSAGGVEHAGNSRLSDHHDDT
jgi:hypothetical protein